MPLTPDRAGALIGRAASTSHATDNNPHAWTSVWTQTGEGLGRNLGDRDAGPFGGLGGPVGGAAFGGVLAGGMGAGMAAGMGAGAQVAGLGVAAVQAVRSATQVYEGVVNQKYHRIGADELTSGGKQQLSAIEDQIRNLFHGGDRPPPQGVLGHFGAAVALLTSLEQLSFMFLSLIPTPALPAVRVMDMEVGVPHAHNHPPNVTPPNPVPVPLPSTGPVLPIPYVSGAATVLINGMPAARCGDMGAAVWCGSYFPLFEIFLGSSSVWLEGARAARVGTDITKHCIFSNPKSFVKTSDLPIGPSFGTTVGSSPNVLIGGFPLPSLTAQAMGGMFKMAFRGIGKVVSVIGKTKAFSRVAAAAKGSKVGQRVSELADDFARMRQKGKSPIQILRDYVKARRLVSQLKRDKVIRIRGWDEYVAKVERDLVRNAMTDTGKGVLNEIRQSGKSVDIRPWDGHYFGETGKPGNKYVPSNPIEAFPGGRGSDGTVFYNPDQVRPPGSPAHVGQMHELGHARNAAQGNLRRPREPAPQPGYPRKNGLEEFNNLKNVDNPYRDEWGYPLRRDYTSPAP